MVIVGDVLYSCPYACCPLCLSLLSFDDGYESYDTGESSRFFCHKEHFTFLPESNSLIFYAGQYLVNSFVNENHSALFETDEDLSNPAIKADDTHFDPISFHLPIIYPASDLEATINRIKTVLVFS